MKRLLVLVAFALIFTGVRYSDQGVYTFTGGDLTVFNNSEQLFLPSGNDKYRIDLPHDYNVDLLIKKANATIKLVEDNIIYAYTPLVNTSVWVHSKRVNIMIHVGKNQINVGIPLLIGSF